MSRILSTFLSTPLVLLLTANTAFAYPASLFGLPSGRPSSGMREESIRPIFQNINPSVPSYIQIVPTITGKVVTRAQFVQAMVSKLHPMGIPSSCFDQLSPSDYHLLFTDVPKDATYGPSLCAAMIMGLVNGYGDVTFRPSQPINIAEASKIIAKAAGLATDPMSPRTVWYDPYVKALVKRGMLPANPPLAEFVTPGMLNLLMGKF
ncbi:MAG: S-layer homology domain-containing protein [Candidatus Peribacteraceae bacterium]|nr:S-layer homology domain-containing protein [Candidatus Peribacteraceae bacterium]